MKKIILLMSILSLALTSCGWIECNSEVATPDESITTAEPTVPETEKYYSADGVELRVNMNQYSENAKLLTADGNFDIYLQSSHCDYISEANGSQNFIIQTEGQLEFVNQNYGLNITTPFEHYKDGADAYEEYTLEYYDYIVQYVQVSSGGYNLKVGALLVDTDVLQFIHTADSISPDEDSEQSKIMDGFLFMASVPKGTLMNDCYTGWTYPQEEIDDIGKMYYKEATPDNILTDTETGVQYVKNQLLISAFVGTEKSEIEDIAENVNAEIVGIIELTSDYQIEFNEDKSLDELAEIADYINSYSFIENVTLNLVSAVETKEEEVTEDEEVEEGYIAVLHGGVGEQTYQTYVYKTDNGYKYINTTSTTVSWGSPQWNEQIGESGNVSTKKEIVEIAKNHHSSNFVTFPNDNNTYEINDFLNMD